MSQVQTRWSPPYKISAHKCKLIRLMCTFGSLICFIINPMEAHWKDTGKQEWYCTYTNDDLLWQYADSIPNSPASIHNHNHIMLRTYIKINFQSLNLHYSQISTFIYKAQPDCQNEDMKKMHNDMKKITTKWKILKLKIFSCNHEFLDTYARDFPLNTIGGATAATTQKIIWICTNHKCQIEVSFLCFIARHKWCKNTLQATPMRL